MHHSTSSALRAVTLALAAGLAGAAGHARAQAPMPAHGGMGHGATAMPSGTTPVALSGQGDQAEMMAAMERNPLALDLGVQHGPQPRLVPVLEVGGIIFAGLPIDELDR